MRKKHHEEVRSPDEAMENAKALLRVANHLDADADKEPTEPLLIGQLDLSVGARRHGIAPVPRLHPAYRYMRDAAGDGVVCE